MDSSTKDGSDSDWDSTLDFTSPRQVGIGQLRPNMQAEEIEEESALSGESDNDEQELPNDQVIRNVLKPPEERPRAPTPTQKENNIILAQKQQNIQQHIQPANQPQHKKRPDSANAPFNFRDAIQDRTTPEPALRGPPGKDRKGTAYDPAPSPTPRSGIVPQGSIRSVGSWDESDPDERILKEIRSKYQQEKLKEEQMKAKEEVSLVEEPDTARSEGTWMSWKKGKKRKLKTDKGSVPATPRSQAPPDSARSQYQGQTTRSSFGKGQIESAHPLQGQVSKVQMPQVIRQQAAPVSTPANVVRRNEVVSPSVIQVIEPRFSKSPRAMAEYTNVELGAESLDASQLGDPEKLFVRDEDTGRYLYYFGHGNLRYYEVTEDYEEARLPQVADKVDKIMQRVWQEMFAVLRILLSVVIWFTVELARFLARHIFQPIIIGVFVTLGDFLMKPFLSAVFNGFVQPLSIFFWNVFTGMRHMFNPIGEILRKVFEQLAMLFSSIRLFEITWVSDKNSALAHQQGVQNV
ncbi:uncharacterized protein LOC128231863 [Mya arenaria]|uniref:uncharacterized protein LOC128231863 n=1 Tax=Mya arenaria TaxID=6604 RepID=UPI0022E2A3E0|nr:uncharacterized protein LOC128231863 [Mya arenaria]